MHGTSQHEAARDLSRYLVHLTRSEADLISIVKDGMIRSGALGPARNNPLVKARQKSVCLTEIPLGEIKRMTAGRPWGLVFDKELLRARFNAQPVWYLNDPSPELSAVKDAMRAAGGDKTASIWKLTPYVAEVRSLEGRKRNDWRWEREWRVRGDLNFELSDVKYVLLGKEEQVKFADQVSVGVPFYSPQDDTVRWVDGISSGWDKEMERMLQRFYEQFVSVEEAGFSWDQEDGHWYAFVEVLSEWDAIEEAFGHVSDDVHKVFRDALSGTGGWCRRYDLQQSFA